jgi:large subunit ribosomal protein L32
MRRNRSQTKQRRSHHGLTAAALSVCSNCGAMHRPHHMCLECGFYNGRQVMDLKAEKEKREARMQAKRERIRADVAAMTAPQTPNEPEKEMKESVPNKEAREENFQNKTPEKARAKQPKS